jgi:hypothetical protein
VVKYFPNRLFILAKGLPSVNGKSVPFAQLRNATGYPDQQSCKSMLLLE